MNAKRRKTETKSDDGRKALFTRFTAGETDAVLAELKQYRSVLRARDASCKQFFNEKEDVFWQVVTFFQLLASDMLAEPSSCTEQAFAALHDAIKILTFGCLNSQISHKSTPTLLFGDRKLIQFPQLLTRILESGERMPTKTKIMLLDLVSGLCTRKEGSLAISNYTALVDRIAMNLSSDDEELRKAALATVMFASKCIRFLKSLLFSNGGYHIGAMLVRHQLTEFNVPDSPLLKLFELVTEFDVTAFGRQLARSPVVPLLIEILVNPLPDDTIRRWQNLLLKILVSSFDLRDAFGKDTLQRVVAEYDGSEVWLKYLCICARDAWGRRALRDTGGLNIILDSCDDTFSSHSFLVSKSFRYFSHDTEGLSAICRNEVFLGKILNLLLQSYAESSKCQVSESRQVLRPDSPNFLIHLNELERQRQTAYLNSTNFHRDYVELNSALPPSNSPRLRCTWSPSSNTRTSASSTPSPATSPHESNLSEDSGDTDCVDALHVSYIPDNDELEELEMSPRTDKRSKMGWYLLELVDAFTHNPENHVQLLKKPVFITLIQLASCRVPVIVVNRVGRSIKRLIRSHECLPHILRQRLHIFAIRNLIRRPCLMTRYAERCNACESKRQFGREAIQELSLQANSTSGWSFMEDLLRSPDSETAFFALSTGVTLIRNIQLRTRMYGQFDALNTLMNRLREILFEALNCSQVILNGNAGADECSRSSDISTEGGVNEAMMQVLRSNTSVLEDTLFAFAALVSHKIQSTLLESQVGLFAEPETPQIDEACQMAQKPTGDLIRFYNQEGRLLISVEKSALSKSSEFYRGMFEHNFVEKTENRRDFTFQQEYAYVTEEHFIKFMHLISGCRGSKCVSIEDTATCVSMILLSDKYLAIDLCNMMFSKEGIAQRFLTGATLVHFAPALVTALSTHGQFSDLFFFVLLRYSTMSEIMEVMCAILNLRAVDAFCDPFRLFLQKCVDSLPDHPSFRVWI